MSKVLGIIAEYNPFHNGHLFHLTKSEAAVNPDYTVCIMSGNFAQRGDTSVINKWSKAQAAINSGIDLVIELPTIYSISSAENFAVGAIKILDSLKMNTTLSFGSECGDLLILNKFADVLCNEPKEYVSLLNHELSKGLSFPKARENALLMYLSDIRKYNILSSSNNILGIEYLKAIRKLKSKIIPITIKRESTDYNSTDIVNNFASATAIREMICKNKNVRNLIPQDSYSVLSSEISHGRIVPSIQKFEKEIIFTLRKMSIEEIADLPDVSEGLEYNIKNAANSCNNISDLISLIKSKRYTQSRIQRILLYALIGITKQDMEDSKKIAPYIRVLGMNGNGKKLLSEIAKANKKLTIITSVKKFMDETKDKSKDKILKNMLLTDIHATDIYTLGYEFESSANLDYTQKIIIEE